MCTWGAEKKEWVVVYGQDSSWNGNGGFKVKAGCRS